MASYGLYDPSRKFEFVAVAGMPMTDAQSYNTSVKQFRDTLVTRFSQVAGGNQAEDLTEKDVVAFVAEMASHNQYCWRGLQLQPGDMPMSERKTAKALCWSRDKLRRRMRMLEAQGLLTIQSIPNVGTMLHVVNWPDTDGVENEEEGTAIEYDINTFVSYRWRGFDRTKFDDWVKDTDRLNIIRAKGILYFKDDNEYAYIYESSGKQKVLTQQGKWYSESLSKRQLRYLINNDENFAHDWDEEYKDKLIKLVFIGQNLDEAAIRKELDDI